MNTPLTLIALCACVLALGACDRKSDPLPTPKVTEAVPAGTGAAAKYGGDPSLPSAAAVDAATTSASAAVANAVRTDGTRKPASDTSVTPVPGQNNDHSAPLSPPKGASTP